MALPKKRKPLADKARIAKALEAAGVRSENKEPAKEKVLKAEAAPEKPVQRKRVGRPPLAENRTARISFYLSPETFDRFELAFLQEQLACAKRKEKIDKSLLLEKILDEWMEKKKY